MGAPTKNKAYAEELARKDFLREVKIKRAYYDLETNERLGDAVGITKGTMRNRMLDPETLTLGELKSLIKVLKLDIWTVLRFVGYDIKEVNKAKKQREEEATCLNS